MKIILEYLKCTLCKEKFLTKKDFKKHMREDHRTMYGCPQCPRTFMSQRDVTKHKENSHDKGHEYECTTCHKVYGTQTALTRHQQGTSNCVRETYECPFHSYNSMNRSFETQRLLERHIATHTGTYEHKCRYCTRSFSVKRHWMNHEQSHAKFNFA